MTKMQMIIAAATGLLLGMGGGTAFAIATKADPPATSTHAAADSLTADSAAHAAMSDSSGHAPADSAASPSGAGTHAAADGVHAQTPAAHSAAPATVDPPQARTAPVVPAPRTDTVSVRLARIFGAMKPEEAATVLARLDDPDVKAVLFQLSDRKAAEILARFPGERAATLTKTMLTDARAH